MKHETKTFTIKCTMNEKWIPHFLGSLRQMQILGETKSSREVTFYADGYGDYRPVFEWDISKFMCAPPAKEIRGDTLFDAEYVKKL